jgi:hypothetical protein
LWANNNEGYEQFNPHPGVDPRRPGRHFVGIAHQMGNVNCFFERDRASSDAIR